MNPSEEDAAMAGQDAIRNNIPLIMKAFGVDEEMMRRLMEGARATDLFSPVSARSREVEAEIDVRWASDRLKVVEDQRAADLETIEALCRDLAAKDETISRMAKHAELKEAHIARRDLTIDSLVAKDARSDADLAKHRQMDEYLREAVARLHVENARLRADLAKAGRDSDRRCLEALDKVVPARDETIARLSRENERLRSDLAQAGKALDKLTKEEANSRAMLDGLSEWHVASVREAARKDAWLEAQQRTIQSMGRRIYGVTPEEWDADEIERAMARAKGGLKPTATCPKCSGPCWYVPLLSFAPPNPSYWDCPACGHVPLSDERGCVIDYRRAAPAPAEQASDPGPFGIDTPDYSDRDREMFVLGYEFAEASRDIRLVTAGYIPPCKISSSERTIHEANLTALLKHVEAAGLNYLCRRTSEGWCHLHVYRRDA